MAHISIAKDYEIKYWVAHKNDQYKTRSDKIVSLFPIDYSQYKVAADIGSGPKSGIFNSVKFDKMFAVDPLWNDYKSKKLAEIPNNVIAVVGEAETFVLPHQCDLIVSANALDHSGSLQKSILNIMSNLRSKGIFAVHVHMRDKSQLNKGHKMLITEHEIDEYFSGLNIKFKKIFNHCPIEDKPYRSYVAVVEKP